MNTKYSFHKISLFVIMYVVILACGGSILAAPTSTPEPTATPLPTYTPRPTSTPKPTATSVPPTPTPASIREVVQSGSIEISVLDVYRHDYLIPGNAYRYWANSGYMIIDVVVKVQNVGSSPASIMWSDVYAIEETGTYNEVLFAGSRSASKNEKVDPLSIDYSTIDGSTPIKIADTVYMRVIFIIDDKSEQTVLLGIGDSPLIGFTVKK